MNWYYALINLLHRPARRRAGSDPYHDVLPQFQRMVEAMQAPVVLEIGARNVTGVTRRHLFPTAGRHVGFDIHAGEGVDMVGDAHRLSSYFPDNSVDAIFSVSVFEHLLAPWKVVLEMNQVLKPGGCVYVSTHPAWPAHELPWDFWRYPVAGISNLFNRVTGFEIVSAAEGLPCKGYSLVADAPTRDFYKYHMNMGVAVIARKIADYDRARLRWDIEVDQVVSTQYPAPA